MSKNATSTNSAKGGDAPKRELKPCPFCGAIWGTGLSIGYKGQPSTSWHVYCVPCKVMGPDAHGAHADTAADAIDKWNQRFAVSATAPSWNAALEAADDAAHDAIHYAIERMDLCEYAKGHVSAAIQALKRPETSATEPSDQQVEAAEGGSSRPAPAESDANGKPAAAANALTEKLIWRLERAHKGWLPLNDFVYIVVITPEERDLALTALRSKVYLCPRCGTGMEEDLSAKHSALRSGPFAEGYEAAREDAAQFLDDADEHELAYQLRALPTRERK